jgi:hypothetical protein
MKEIDEAFRALEQYDMYIGHEEIVDKLKDLIQQEKKNLLDSVVKEAKKKSFRHRRNNNITWTDEIVICVQFTDLKAIVDKLKSELK